MDQLLVPFNSDKFGMYSDWFLASSLLVAIVLLMLVLLLLLWVNGGVNGSCLSTMTNDDDDDDDSGCGCGGNVNGSGGGDRCSLLWSRICKLSISGMSVL